MNDAYLVEQLTELAAERDYMAECVDERKPYWLGLRHPRDGEMTWDLWNYAPLAHYDLAMDRVRDRVDDHDHDADDVRMDGGYGDLHSGSRKSSVYYWVDPKTDAVLAPTEVNGDPAPFYPDVGAAERELEHRMAMDGEDALDRFSLYEAKVRKVEDAVDVLTDQSGIDEYL